ncbi:unnamed protein product, partial [Brassica rapa subsp. trilocularis]
RGEDVRTEATISSSPTTIDLCRCEPKATRCVSHSTGDTFISFQGICSSKRNRDRSCTAKVIDVASWPRINLRCCGAETVPTSPSVKTKRSTKTEAFSMEICQGIAAVFVCDQPGGEAILVDQLVADRSRPGGYGQRTYSTTFLPAGLKV